jgi:hypothetical protein
LGIDHLALGFLQELGWQASKSFSGSHYRSAQSRQAFPRGRRGALLLLMMSERRFAAKPVPFVMARARSSLVWAQIRYFLKVGGFCEK